MAKVIFPTAAVMAIVLAFYVLVILSLFSIVTYFIFFLVGLIGILIASLIERSVPGWENSSITNLDRFYRSIPQDGSSATYLADSIVIESPKGIRIIVRARKPEIGGGLAYKVTQNAHGWVGLIILLLPFISSIFVIPYLTYQRATARNILASCKMTDAPNIERQADSEIDEGIRQSIKEAYNIASDARNSAVSSYQDEMIVVASSSFLVWAMAFLTIAGGTGQWTRIIVALALSIVLAAFFATPFFLWTRKRWRGRIGHLNEWTSRLLKGMQTEDQGELSASSSRSELLLDAARQVPHWISTRKEGFMYIHPFVSFWIMVSCLYAIQSFFFSLMSLTSGDGMDIWSNAYVLIATFLLFEFNIVIYIYYKHQDTEAAKELAQVWQDRLDRMNEKMEELVRGP